LYAHELNLWGKLLLKKIPNHNIGTVYRKNEDFSLLLRQIRGAA
jgi:hypothetical protein